MYTIDDLDAIYNKGKSPDNDPVEVDFDLAEKLGNVAPLAPNSLRGGQRQFNPEPYAAYMPNHSGVYEDRNLDVLRGEEQSGWDKFGNAIVQTAGKFGTQLLDMAGGIGSLATQWGDNRNYKNGFTEAADLGNTWLDENFPLYRSTQGTWGLTDASWWLQNASGLIASVGGFAIGGAGIAKGLGALGKLTRAGEGLEALIASGTELSTARSIVQGGERTLTAGMLAYSEGAMSGRVVFDQVYTAQLAQGKSDEEAKHIAAESAATTVQLNTIMNTGMNLMGGMNMFFNHEKNAVVETAKKVLKQQEGETLKDWVLRLATETPNKYAAELGTNMGLRGMGKKGLTALREATAEGVEELTNQFAERTGIEEGKKGKTYSLVDQLGQISNYFDRTMDQEGALNFVMGAIAGPIQNTIASTLPIHKVQEGTMQNSQGELLNEKGEVVTDVSKAAPKYTYMNSIKKNRSMTDKFFTNIRDKVLEDAKFLESTENAIQKAIMEGRPLDAEELKHDYFNVLNRNSVHLGFADNLKETYRQISQVDNTKVDKAELQEKLTIAEQVLDQQSQTGEDTTQAQLAVTELKTALANAKGHTAAMKLGFTGSTEDNSYKDRALEAIQTLDELQAIHEKVQKRYGIDKDTANIEESHIADHIFDRMATLHVNKKRLGKLENELAKLDEDLVGTEGIESEVAAIQKIDKDTTRQREGLRNRIQTLNSEIDIFQKFVTNPVDPQVLENAMPLLNKYGGINNGANLSTAMERVARRLEDMKIGYEIQLENLASMKLESPEYLAWVESNPGKSYKDYENQLAKTYASTKERQQYQEAVMALKDRIQVQAEEVNALQNARTMNTLLKNTKNYFKELEKKAKAEHGIMQAKVEEFHKNKEAQDKAQVNELKRLRGKYRQEMENIQKKLPSLEFKLKELKDRLNEVVMNNSDAPYERQYIMSMINETSEEILTMTERFKVLQTLYYETHPATAAPTFIAPPGPIRPTVIPPPAPVVIPPPVTVAFKAYQDELNLMSTTDKDKVYTQLKAIRDGKPWGLNNLKELSNGPRIMQLMKEMLLEEKVVFEEIDGTIEEAEQVLESSLPTEESVETAEGEPSIYGVLSNLEGTTLPDLETGESWAGAKQKNAENSAASLSTLYSVQKKGDTNLKISTQFLNDKVSLQVLLPTGLLPGTKLRLVVDEDYDGTINSGDAPSQRVGNTKQKASKFSDFIKDGKVEMNRVNEDTKGRLENFENVPIKIVDDKGRTVAYVHRVDWVLEKVEGTTEQYRNVVDEWTEGDQLITGNALRTASALTALRRAIVEQYNLGNKEGLETVVENKGPGQLVFLSNFQRASAHIKGPNVQLAHVKDANTLQGTNLTKINTQGKDWSGWENRLVALLPMANGTHSPVPLVGTLLADSPDLTKIGKGNETWQTMARAIELHVSPIQEEIDEVKKVTGFDLSTSNGFRDFMVQYYTYFTPAKNFLESNKEGIIIDTLGTIAGEPTIRIIERTPLGLKETPLRLENGQLNRASKQALATLLSTRYKSPAFTKGKVKGLNNTESFNYSVYLDGKWSHKSAANYNQYILSHLTTNVTFAKDKNDNTYSLKYTDNAGRERTEYIYGVNPIISFNQSMVLDQNKRAAVNLEDGEIGIAPPVEDFVVEGLVLNPWEARDQLEPVPSVGSTNKPVISLQSLETLFTFTPLEDRNGKSPQEMLDYYRSINVTHLQENYNPFKKCK